ncbi:SusD/RagB family nutrient-binding outer membrane lipoprotein [Flammeovirgaceae bacterium SG7u.111]|nr:SusD/RagB family nutrient-binding outer membrane lipoprotein [Flammeovirgaceae bacterium SG7u.132]WPO35715.1 SusD/RagB family nutrient-binding outer membrane lipoprotein [Flammeovirgaceae bacterium SG7u.111]
MKKFLINTIILGGLLMVAIGCSDKLEEYYADPNKTTEPEMSKLLTYMFNNDRIKPTYWDYRTFTFPTTAKYTQFYGFSVSNKVYQNNLAYTEDRWEAFYTGGIMNSYRSMEKAYNEMGEDEKERNKVFLQVAKVLVYDHAAQLVDLWGDIPFSEAGQINLTSALVNAKFDDASEVYTTIIAELAEVNTYLASADLPSTVETLLAAQDIMNNGDLLAWRKYANSLRLRLLMRISNIDEATAKSTIATMLADPTTYPLIDGNDENAVLEMYPEGSSLYSEIHAVFSDLTPVAAELIVEDVMDANEDPRTDVFWDAGTEGFVGLPADVTANEQQDLINSGAIATFDSATFIYNWNIPGVMITAAEVNFIKAEAFERWGGGDAQGAYETAIRQSIEFYYTLNQAQVQGNGNNSFSRDPMDSPSEEAITNFLSKAAIAYTGTTDQKLEKIATQKWVNYFILQADQAWAEVRRTGYPVLEFKEDPGTNELPPNRLLYPATEKSNNGANYEVVKGDDLREGRIFWDVN